MILAGSTSCKDEVEFGACPCTTIDHVPWYKGCGYMSDCDEAFDCSQKSMLETVYRTMRYPAEARENKIQGRIVVEFDVDIFGNADNFRVQSDTLGYGIPEAAIEGALVLSEQGFYPALENCEPVEFVYVVPIIFKLQ